MNELNSEQGHDKSFRKNEADKLGPSVIKAF